MAHSSRQPGVGALRERLKALGYLDAGVNRFVLAPATGARSAPAIAWRSSVRIGLLAGLLLGPAAAIGIGLRLPGLVTGPRDAIVIALYLAALFGLTVAVAAFAAAEVARRVAARRARLSATLTGVGVGALCLLYLTLWWRTANAGFGWSAPGWTAFALGVAVAISLLLGHAVSLTTLALIARASDGASLEPRARRSFWTLTGPLGLVAFAGAAVLLLSTTPSGPSAAPAPDFAVVPTGAHATVLAIDGFDVALFKELSDAGGMPNLSSLERARARLAPQATTDPAAVWTTIATGQPPAVHGVAGLETRRLAGVQGAVAASRSPLVVALAAATDLVRLTRPAIASADERREKTFWEVAAEKGLRTAVINWWATWPAPPGAGIVLSDRALIRLERGGVLDAEIAPPDLYQTLRSEWPALRDAARARASSAFGDIADDEARAVLRRSGELDALVLELATSRALGPLDLLVAYLPGLDIAQHTLLAGPDSSAVSPSLLAGRVAALEAYYRFIDDLVGPLVASAGASGVALVAVVTQPGRVAGGAGLFAIAGAEARAGERVDARAVDLAPTLLYALGLPASRQLAGQPLLPLFAPAFVARYPVREVASYGPRVAPDTARHGQALDAEAIERLRSLGYVR